jgi:SNF2 family DNA or RNA helicase
MRLVFNNDKTAVIFMHEDGKEYKFLHDFPALFRGTPYFYLPAKVGVVHNVLSRIKAHYKKVIKVDQDVHDFISTPVKLKTIPEDFYFHTKPHEAQLIALRFIYTFESGGLLLAPGMGKSKTVLDYIYLKQFKRSIIVCPKPLCFVWSDERDTHRPELSIYIVQTTDWDKEVENIKSAEVVVINYNKAVIFADQLAKLKFDFINLDEALIKDVGSQRTQTLTKLAQTIPYRCLGSGTLINNSVMDCFSPTRFLEPSLVGASYRNFLNHHSVRVKGKTGLPDKIVGFKHIKEAKSILETCCIVMSKEEWLKDLPGKEFDDTYVQPSDYQRKLASDLSSNYIAEVEGEYIEIDNPLVMLSKLYQISQGFIHKNYLKDDVDDLLGIAKEPGKKSKKLRKTFKFEEQPKLDALQKIIDTKLGTNRAIIWFNLTAEYELIKERLEKLGKTFLTIRGGEKDTGGKVRTFNADPTYQFLVCQAKSVNYGITILGNQKGIEDDSEEDDGGEYLVNFDPQVFTEIFYSLSFSSETYSQQQDRVHRLGQKHTCKYYRIFCNTPIEHQIRKAIDDKISLRGEMLVDIAHSLKSLEQTNETLV